MGQGNYEYHSALGRTVCHGPEWAERPEGSHLPTSRPWSLALTGWVLPTMIRGGQHPLLKMTEKPRANLSTCPHVGVSSSRAGMCWASWCGIHNFKRCLKATLGLACFPPPFHALDLINAATIKPQTWKDVNDIRLNAAHSDFLVCIVCLLLQHSWQGDHCF